MILQIPVEVYDSNFAYFIISKDKSAAIVDPGDLTRLEYEIKENALSLSMILLTHSHHDHTQGVLELAEKHAAPVYMHKNARGRVDVPEELSVFIDEGEMIKLDELNIKALHTPGHIDDSLCYYFEDGGKHHLITGDTVFVEGCGRSDLKGSNVEDLYKSIQRIKKFDDEVKIYPGHDYGSIPVSTVGHEKKHNKYFLCHNFETFKKLRMIKL